MFSLILMNQIIAEEVIAEEVVTEELVEEPQVITEEEKKLLDQADEADEEESDEEEPTLTLLDQVEAEVVTFGPEGSETTIITTMDRIRRGFDGNKYSEDDLIDQTLADQFSRVLKVNISNEDINRNFKKMGITQKEVKSIADGWYFSSVDQFYEELKMIQRANAALKFEIESQLVASEEDIKREYDKKEIYEEAFYIIETAFVPYSEDKSIDDLKKELNDYAKGIPTAANKFNIDWDQPVRINENEIPAANKFLLDLPVGDIFVKDVPGGFDLFRMKRRQLCRLVPLEDRRREIVGKLQQERYPEAYQKAMKRLRSEALISRPSQVFSVPKDVEELC